MLVRALRWVALVAVTLFVGYELYVLGSVYWLRAHNPPSTAFMTAERERLSALKPPVRIRQTWVRYSAISMHAKRAVIAAEDSGFVDHEGIDWEAIEKAARENLEKGKIRRGGSTITMQLAKNLFLSADRSLVRKGQEVVITTMLEGLLEKRRILEIYLNVAEWGIGVFGIEAAAQHYFGVNAASLTAEQAAWLAAILPAPRRYDRNRGSSFIQSKTETILARMPLVRVP
ncbi:MAG: monofunctional biosynthetic peptidoglycan transglycosylase [Burkholderiaceae bacterium]|jgi:monofunctional biosynthetic peptidoglycan transglycosylase